MATVSVRKKQSFYPTWFACLFLAGNLSAEDAAQTAAPPPLLSCTPSCQNANRFYVQAEALYWKTTEDNIAFAELSSLNISTVGTTHTILETNDHEELDFEWKPGVRIDVGFAIPNRPWDLDFNWTHIVTGASKSVSAPDLSVSEKKGSTSASGTILTPIWLSSAEETGEVSVPLDTVNELNANLHISFNNYEGTFGQMICSSPGFHLQVLCGPKYTRIAQKYRFSYVRNLLDSGGLSGAGDASQTIRSRYNGVGLQGGLQAEWLLGCGFSIYSSFAGGILYGHAHVQDKQNTHTTTTDSHEDFFETENNKDSRWATRPNIDLVLGLEWEHCFRKSYLLVLKAGWEYHNYFDQNLLRLATADDPARGSLAFHGVTFGAGFGY